MPFQVSRPGAAIYEWIIMEYDALYSVQHPFELEFQWKSVSGPLVAEFVSSVMKKAKQFHFSFTQVSADPDAASPFHPPKTAL